MQYTRSSFHIKNILHTAITPAILEIGAALIKCPVIKQIILLHQ